MSGYTEVLQVIGATIIFSLILTTANRFMLTNTQRQVGTEVEISAVTLAQDLIEEAKLRLLMPQLPMERSLFKSRMILPRPRLPRPQSPTAV